jgi:hypothetical protein
MPSDLPLGLDRHFQSLRGEPLHAALQSQSKPISSLSTSLGKSG